MDDKLKRRIVLFYVGGVVNAFLGLYVLFEGSSFLEPGTARMLMGAFFAFAAVDFYFPYALKKKWRADHAAGQGQGGGPTERP